MSPERDAACRLVREAERPGPLPLAGPSGWEPAPPRRQFPADWTPEQVALAELVHEQIKRSLAQEPPQVPRKAAKPAPVGYTIHSGMIPTVASTRGP